MSCSISLSEKAALEEVEVQEVCPCLGTMPNADTIARWFVCLWVGCWSSRDQQFCHQRRVVTASQGRSKSS